MLFDEILKIFKIFFFFLSKSELFMMENQQYFEILKNTFVLFNMKINILFDKHVLELIAPQL